jgi:hypothetical protein
MFALANAGVTINTVLRWHGWLIAAIVAGLAIKSRSASPSQPPRPCALA